jgi:hypothetical protein
LAVPDIWIGSDALKAQCIRRSILAHLPSMAKIALKRAMVGGKGM